MLWLTQLQDRALAIAEKRLPALTRLREPESLPIRVHFRRIYVLPTRFGLAFGVLLAGMTLGGLNYNNNPALMLCFLIASVAHTSLLRGFLGMRDIRLAAVATHAVHAGDEARVGLRFESDDRRPRAALQLRVADRAVVFSHPGTGASNAEVSVPTQQRGWLTLGRIVLSNRQPLGLFVAWSWMNPDARILVWPALENSPPPLPRRGGEGQMRRRRGLDEQLHALRDYRAGDPLRLIAWKRSAQTGQLLVREFETPAGRDALLDFAQLAGLSTEQRLSRLARWVIDAERAGVRSELILPNRRIGPGSGIAHVNDCLRQLALFGIE